MSSDSLPTPSLDSNSDSSSSSASVARSSLIMASGTFVSRILGVVRSPILLTMVVGLNSPIANAFDIANMLPNYLFNIIAGGLINAVLVPAIVRASKNGPDAGGAYINKLLTIAIIFLGTFTIALTLCAPILVKAFAATLDNSWYQLTVILAYWCIPQLFFYGLYTVIGQILNARENFGPYMWVPAANNLVSILGLVLLLLIFSTPSSADVQNIALWIGWRSQLLAAISTSGVAVQALLLIIPLRRLGIRYRPDFRWRGVGLRSAGIASLWALASTLASLIPQAITTNVAASATQRALDLEMDISTVAGNAASTTAYSIFVLPVSLIATSITTAIFTRLSKAAAANDLEAMRNHSSHTLNSMAPLNFLCVSLMICFAFPIARVFVPAGSPNEITALAWLIIPMSIGIIPLGAILLFNRVCFAFEDTRGIFLMTLPGQIFSCIGDLACMAFLPPQYIVCGASVVLTVGYCITCTGVAIRARQRMGGLNGKEIAQTHLPLLGVTIVTTAAGLGTLWLIGFERVTQSVGAAIIAGSLGAPLLTLLFLLLIHLLKIPEADAITQFLSRFTHKLRR